MRRRYPLFLLVATTVIHVTSCLVFDGKAATVVDAGTSETGSDAPLDGRDSSQSGDARDADLDHLGDDAGTRDQVSQDASAGADGGEAAAPDGVVCGGTVCPIASGLKCCAKGGGASSTAWTFLSPPCQAACSDGGGTGFYDFKCNDSEDCATGVCCAFRLSKSAPPYTTSVCQAKCTAPAAELCQLSGSATCKLGGTCTMGDRHFLPPGFDWCQ